MNHPINLAFGTPLLHTKPRAETSQLPSLTAAVCSADEQKAKKSGSRGALGRGAKFGETSQLPSLTAVCSAEEQKAKKSGSRGGPTEARKPRIRFLRRIGKRTIGKRRAHSCVHPSDCLLRRRQCLSALVLVTGKFWRWFSVALSVKVHGAVLPQVLPRRQK